MNNEQSMPGKATAEVDELRRNSDEQQKLLHCIHPFKLFLLIFFVYDYGVFNLINVLDTIRH